MKLDDTRDSLMQVRAINLSIYLNVKMYYYLRKEHSPKKDFMTFAVLVFEQQQQISLSLSTKKRIINRHSSPFCVEIPPGIKR